jgi:hypothetical protein
VGYECSVMFVTFLVDDIIAMDSINSITICVNLGKIAVETRQCLVKRSGKKARSIQGKFKLAETEIVRQERRKSRACSSF